MSSGTHRPDRELWQAIRNMVLERDEYSCQICGTWLSLQVHHICPREAGGSDLLDNLITLCHDCHREVHRPRGVRVGAACRGKTPARLAS